MTWSFRVSNQKCYRGSRKGSLLVTDSGISGELKDAFDITDKHGYETTDIVMGAIGVPPGSCEGKGLLEKQGTTKSAQRAILKRFNIRVIVYPERVEIKGTIPIQILDKTKNEKETAGIIPSPCGTDNPTHTVPFLIELEI